MVDSTTTQSTTASKIDRWTHVVFPARSFIKECIYWPAEIVAGVFFFIWILQMDLVEFTNPADTSKTIKTYKTDETRLELREYGWIALCYTIKHFVYIIDTVLLMKEKRNLPYDIVTPIANFLMWGLWMLYGFFYTQQEIYGGYSYRVAMDTLNLKKDKGGLDDATYNASKDQIEAAYKESAKWKWLWVPTGIVAIINLAFWILGLLRKRSSLYTNATLSSFCIALSLFFLSLMQKGWWISSNVKYYAENPPTEWSDVSGADVFEARYIFPIIYFASWIGLLYAIVCVYRAILAKSIDMKDTIKFILYAVFWISGFFWCLFVDGTVYHTYIYYKLGLIITTIICLVVALIIGAISIIQKKSLGDTYYNLHDGYASW